MRYHDGERWTFWTAPVEAKRDQTPAEPEEPTPKLRSDIATAASLATDLLGAMKEVRRLESRLTEGEDVVALTAARGSAGIGALACTTRRVVFLFDGLVTTEFLEASLPQIHVVELIKGNKAFRIFTSRRTKRAKPAIEVKVQSFKGGERVARAIEHQANAPRLDTMTRSR